MIDIQEDILEDTSYINELKYLADTIVDIQGHCSYKVTHRSSGGKIKRESLILKDNKLTIVTIKNTTTESSVTSSDNPLPQSTFNLLMTEEQLAAKANVALPHMRILSEGIAAAPTYSKSILAEDYDDEDPDDDLDI